MDIKILFIMVALLIASMAFAQDYTFIGRKYTVDAIDKRVEGKVYVEFYLDSKGKIVKDSVKALNKLNGLEMLAIEVVQDSPDYKKTGYTKPQKEFNKFVIPIVFSLDQLKNKDWSKYHLIKGKQFGASGSNESAIKKKKKSISFYKKNAEAYYQLGKIYEQQNRTNQATKNYEKARKFGYDM